MGKKNSKLKLDNSNELTNLSLLCNKIIESNIYILNLIRSDITFKFKSYYENYFYKISYGFLYNLIIICINPFKKDENNDEICFICLEKNADLKLKCCNHYLHTKCSEKLF